MDSAKRRIPNMRCLRGAAHQSARPCAQLLFTGNRPTVEHRKSDRRRVYRCAGERRRRGSSIPSAMDIQSLFHCGVESKKAESTHEPPESDPLNLVTTSASLALADDITTTTGKVYKNASVSRVEPDGLMVKFSGGLVKIPFADLPKELQQQYHYDPEASQKYAADTAAQINAQTAVKAVTTHAKKQDENAVKSLQSVLIFAIIKPFHYGKNETVVYLQQFEKYWVGPTAYDFAWREVGKQFTATLDEPMPEYFEEGDVIPVALYRIGHSNDSSRHPLYTMSKDKAMQVLNAGTTNEP